jgi:hypothetical protein
VKRKEEEKKKKKKKKKRSKAHFRVIPVPHQTFSSRRPINPHIHHIKSRIIKGI